MAFRDSDLVRYVDPSGLDSDPSAFSADELSILDQVNRKVAAAESVEKIIDFLFESTEGIFPCDRIALAFIEDGGRRVVSHYARASYSPLLLGKGYAEDLQGSTLSKVVETGAPRIISDLERYLEAKPDSPSTRILVKEGVRSSMTCPLEVDGRRVGFLFRSSRDRGVYDDRQVMLHLAVAERLAQAVEKAWRIEQLTEANRSYFEMLGFVAHELKSPLASIVMNGSVLADSLLGELSTEQADMVRRMTGKAEYLLSLIREYLDLSMLEGGGFSIKRRPDVNLKTDVIAPAVDILDAQIKERRVQVEVSVPDPAPSVSCDPDALRIVAANLIGNAVKYGNEAGRVRIALGFDSDAFTVTVWNEGPGFSDEDRGLLFRRFSRLKEPELAKRKGTGLGLYTSWRIVNLHGGRIWARSERGSWAEFSFKIPIASDSSRAGPGVTKAVSP